MSRPVALRYGGTRIEGRITLRGGTAIFERDGEPLTRTVARDGAWMTFGEGADVRRAAVARDGRGIWVMVEGRLYRFDVEHRHAGAHEDEASSGEVRAPMTGKVAAVEAAAGQTVAEGDLILTIEAMKMEFKVTAPTAGRVSALSCAPGDRVELGQVLARIETA